MKHRPLWLTIPLLVITLVVVLWTHCNAEEPRLPILHPVPVKPPGSTPTIQPELEIRYLRAIVADQAAQEKATSTQAVKQKVIKEIIDACGPEFIPQDPVGPKAETDGRLKCVPKPDSKVVPHAK